MTFDTMAFYFSSLVSFFKKNFFIFGSQQNEEEGTEITHIPNPRTCMASPIIIINKGTSSRRVVHLL